MSNYPIVSILLPCYNVEAYLPKCLDTVLAQTYTNLQVVLIDDGSKDGTWSVMQEYAVKDARMEIYHQENQGVAATRNHLLDKIKGDYVLFVDSDDWIELDMVEFLVSKITENDADMVVCVCVADGENRFEQKLKDEIWCQEKAIIEFLRHQNLNGSLCNKLVRTSLLHNVKFHCGISYGEDALFFWYVLQKVKKAVITDRALYHYRINYNSLSHQTWTPEKKGTGHIAWEIISKETETTWPQYLQLANARFAIEDMWGLYAASLSDYPYDIYIKERQLNIRKNLKSIRKSGMVSLNKIVAAYALSYFYPLGRFLKYIRK